MNRMKKATLVMLGLVALQVGTVAFADEEVMETGGHTPGDETTVEYSKDSTYKLKIPATITLHQTSTVSGNVTVEHNLHRDKKVEVNLNDGKFDKHDGLIVKDTIRSSSYEVYTKMTKQEGKERPVSVNDKSRKILTAQGEKGTATSKLNFGPVGTDTQAGLYKTTLTFRVDIK